MKIVTAFSAIVLLMATTCIAQDHVPRHDTTNRLVAINLPYKRIPNVSFIVRAGSCSISCTSGSSSSNTCPDPQTCSCYCDGSDTAQCTGCS